jgi:hypothetical protein
VSAIDPTLPTTGIGLGALALLQVGSWLRSEAQARLLNRQVQNGSTTKLRDDVDEILTGVRSIRGDVRDLDRRLVRVEVKAGLE